MLCSATGMMLMASANDLIIVFLALEILSIALYVLAAFDRRRLESQEAGLKYFILGSFSSAVFLYGIALTYGATGSTNLTKIADYLASTTLFDDGVLLLGLALMLVGLGFKVAAAPFHMWTPDVYEGAPTPVTAFMAGATKAAAFGATLRLLVGSFDLYRVDWRPAVWVLAVLSLLVGSIAALVQTDVKRMLAYSSISHAGYILIGVQAATDAGTSAALFYLMTYALMVIGAFAVITVISRRDDAHHKLVDYRGLSARQPALAGLLTLFLLAQAGVPLTGGFVAKLSIFDAAVDEGQYSLALIGMLTAAIAAFVYLRIVLTMYAPDESDDAVPSRGPPRRRHHGDVDDRRRWRPVPRHPPELRARIRERRHPTPRRLRARCLVLRLRKPECGDQTLHWSGAGAATAAGLLLGLVDVQRPVELDLGEFVRLVDELLAAREVEQLPRVTGPRQHDHLDPRRDRAQLEVEPHAAGNREARHHHVEGGALDVVDVAGRDVEHDDPVDGSGEGVRERHGVHHAAVDEAAAVVLHDGKYAGQRGTREQSGLERTPYEHDFLAAIEVSGDDP